MLALADDLTGALEVGARFAAQGIDTSVATGARLERRAVVVIDTETRHLTPEAAAARVRSDATASQSRLIYKKTDSTLRGNIGAELGALLAMRPDTPLIYAPAYPAMGRTVTRGCLHVHGSPAHQTAFGGDALNPVTDSDIARVLRAQTRAPVFSIDASGLSNLAPGAIYVVDGESDEEIDEAARVILSGAHRLAAGPAALAAAIAQRIDLPRSAVAPWPRIQRCLVVNGSRHELSARQVCHAVELGWPVGDPDAILNSGWSILNCIASAEVVGKVAADILTRVKLDALTIFGGDTAYGILRAIGNPVLCPLGEIVPGVALSKVEGRDLYLITKAGGFGPVDVLRKIRDSL